MKFEKGDKVKIKDDLIVGATYGGYRVTDAMSILLGNNAIVTNVGGLTYELDIDDARFGWTDGMLEPIHDNQLSFTDVDVDADKWFELFSIGISQGYGIKQSSEMADNAMLQYQKRLKSR